MDMQKFIELCKNRSEVKSVVATEDGADLVVRSKIVIYDDDAISRILGCPYTSEDEKAVLARLPEIQQEHRFVVHSGEWPYAEMVEHKPFAAFGNPFCDMGDSSYEVRCAMEDDNCEGVLDLLIAEVASFNVEDMIMVEKLVDWVLENKPEFR